MSERERLARELHDTVAHHVSAIAIQAQAGRALASQRAEAPMEALEIIEEAASSTLSEMRRIVRAMRSEADSEYVPVTSIEGIEQLARAHQYPLAIDMTLSGDLENLDATVISTLYRLTQESITNAVRHAVGANTVTVAISGDRDYVGLNVQDDGNLTLRQPQPGLGIQGMSERVALLGGTFTAGPGQQSGWIVSVQLPKQAATP